MTRSGLTRNSPQMAWMAIPLIRLGVGAVFLSEGIQKFLFPAVRGAGRFAEIGFTAPGLLSSVVGGFEIVCGALILLGWYTRLAAIPTSVIMLVAILTTKLPILLGETVGPFGATNFDSGGFWSMAHAMRTDYAMLLGSMFLIIAGSGPWSIDNARRTKTPDQPVASA